MEVADPACLKTMVPVFLKKLAMGLLFLGLSCCIMAMARMVCVWRDDLDRFHCKTDESEMSVENEICRADGIDGERYRMLAGEIIQAYSNRQPDVVMSKARNLLRDPIKDGLAPEMSEGLMMLKKEWDKLRCADMADFRVTRDVLSERILSEFAFVQAYGDFCRLKCSLDEELVAIDTFFLKHLQQIRDSFLQSGDVTLALDMESFVARWIDKIESEDGFMRSYMRALMGRLSNMKDPEVTPKEKMQSVRSHATGTILQQCGYLPRWVDREFPSLP